LPSLATSRQLVRALNLAKKVIDFNSDSGQLKISPRSLLAQDSTSYLEVSWPDSAIIDQLEVEQPVGVAPKDLSKLLKEWKPSEPVSLTVSADQQLQGAGITLPVAGRDQQLRPWAAVAADYSSEPIAAYQPERLAPICTHAAEQDIRPILSGVYFDQHGVVATDAYRLASDQEAPAPSLQTGFSLPAKKLSAVAAVASTDISVVDVNEQRARLETLSADGGRLILEVSKLPGRFPEYQKLIPEQFAFSARLDYQQAVEQAAKCQRWQSGNRPAVLQVAELCQLGIDGPDGQVQFADISQPGDQPLNEMIEIGVNPQFLLSALQLLDGDQVEISVISGQRPLLLSGQQRQVLLMPIRV